MKRGRKCLLAFSLLFFCCLPASSSAETVYTVTESQMEIWTQGLYKLKSNNETLQAQLETQEERLTLLKTQLDASKTAIGKAQTLQTEAETSLQSLNSSWQTYKEQSARTEKRLERQRTTWAILAGILAAAAAAK